MIVELQFHYSVTVCFILTIIVSVSFCKLIFISIQQTCIEHKHSSRYVYFDSVYLD